MSVIELPLATSTRPCVPTWQELNGNLGTVSPRPLSLQSECSEQGQVACLLVPPPLTPSPTAAYLSTYLPTYSTTLPDTPPLRPLYFLSLFLLSHSSFFSYLTQLFYQLLQMA